MAQSTFKHNEVVVLLGAGSSVEAGIPDSHKMAGDIEKLVSGSVPDKWREFRDLYWLIKSSIFFSDGLHGTFGNEVSYNIERLVNILDELDQKERHTLFPFVGAWSPKLQQVAGDGFKSIRHFRDMIVGHLRNRWLALPDWSSGSYYEGLLRFQEEYQYPLRVFSLNYDLCLEEICRTEHVGCERGFSQSDRHWDWRLFDQRLDDSKEILLYKLHGSMDWEVQPDGKVSYVDSPSSINRDNVAMIFGTSYKLQYVDPFLFLAYELRRWTLDSARLIVTIGYGFGDDHINGILQQALRQHSERILLAVVAPGSADRVNKGREEISKKLAVNIEQIQVDNSGASQFLTTRMNISYLAALFPEQQELFGEM